MSFLVRSRVGDFALADALTLDDLDPRREKPFCNGLGTGERRHVPEADILRVYSAGRFLGIGRYDRRSQEVIPAKVVCREPATKN